MVVASTTEVAPRVGALEAQIVGPALGPSLIGHLTGKATLDLHRLQPLQCCSKMGCKLPAWLLNETLPPPRASAANTLVFTPGQQTTVCFFVKVNCSWKKCPES